MSINIAVQWVDPTLLNLRGQLRKIRAGVEAGRLQSARLGRSAASPDPSPCQTNTPDPL